MVKWAVRMVYNANIYFFFFFFFFVLFLLSVVEVGAVEVIQ